MCLAVLVNLVRNFCQHFLLERDRRQLFEFSKRDELNNVSLHFFSFAWNKRTSVGIESFHHCEIARSDSNNDDTQRAIWSIDDSVLCFFEIRYLAICDNQQDHVRLRMDERVDCLCRNIYDCWHQIARWWKLDGFKSITVNIKNSLTTIDILIFLVEL